jgi:hypothetical protein
MHGTWAGGRLAGLHLVVPKALLCAMHAGHHLKLTPPADGRMHEMIWGFVSISVRCVQVDMWFPRERMRRTHSIP